VNDKERELLDRALSTLICALAHDEAVIHGASVRELAELRGFWVPDAEKITEDAEHLGLLNGDLDFDDDDLDGEDFDDEEDDFDDDDQQ
jgi:hypothetical protein